MYESALAKALAAVKTAAEAKGFGPKRVAAVVMVAAATRRGYPLHTLCGCEAEAGPSHTGDVWVCSCCGQVPQRQIAHPLH